jgi:hypothetical protein
MRISSCELQVFRIVQCFFPDFCQAKVTFRLLMVTP